MFWGKIVDKQCQQNHDACACKARAEYVPVTKVVYQLSAAGCDKCGGASGRVNGIGNKHDPYCQRYGQAQYDCLVCVHESGYRNAHESRKAMSEHNIARLCQGTFHGAEDQYGGSAERCDKKGKISQVHGKTVQVSYDQQTYCAARHGQQYGLSARALRHGSCGLHFLKITFDVHVVSRLIKFCALCITKLSGCNHPF